MGSSQPLVDIFSMARREDDNEYLLAMDSTDDAMVLDAVSP